MSLLPIDPSQGEDFQMSSYEFLTKVINPAREEAGEKPVRNDDFLARVRDELDFNCENFVVEKMTNRRGHEMGFVMLDRRSLLLVGMRESKAVRRRVLDFIESQDMKLKAALKQQAELARITNRRSGTTWGDFCQLHGLHANKLMDVLLKKDIIFRRDPISNVWRVPKNLAKYFMVISPTNRRFSTSGLNFRFNSTGYKYFSQPEKVQKFRDIYDEYYSGRP
ncbi:TPA: hypothetical protein J1W51_001724 [Escherichia coli]|nr:hypothetical protein [Escherichia coli]